MAASLSKNLRTAEIECPIYHSGLERLRRSVDRLMCKVIHQFPQINPPATRTDGDTYYFCSSQTDEYVVGNNNILIFLFYTSFLFLLRRQLLDKLPHTVRGMGMTLLRPILPEGRLARNLQQRRDVLANLLGFIVVVWYGMVW